MSHTLRLSVVGLVAAAGIALGAGGAMANPGTGPEWGVDAPGTGPEWSATTPGSGPEWSADAPGTGPEWSADAPGTGPEWSTDAANRPGINSLGGLLGGLRR